MEDEKIDWASEEATGNYFREQLMARARAREEFQNSLPETYDGMEPMQIIGYACTYGDNLRKGEHSLHQNIFDLFRDTNVQNTINELYNFAVVEEFAIGKQSALIKNSEFWNRLVELIAVNEPVSQKIRSDFSNKHHHASLRHEFLTAYEGKLLDLYTHLFLASNRPEKVFVSDRLPVKFAPLVAEIAEFLQGNENVQKVLKTQRIEDYDRESLLKVYTPMVKDLAEFLEIDCPRLVVDHGLTGALASYTDVENKIRINPRNIKGDDYQNGYSVKATVKVIEALTHETFHRFQHNKYPRKFGLLDKSRVGYRFGLCLAEIFEYDLEARGSRIYHALPSEREAWCVHTVVGRALNGSLMTEHEIAELYAKMSSKEHVMAIESETKAHITTVITAAAAAPKVAGLNKKPKFKAGGGRRPGGGYRP